MPQQGSRAGVCMCGGTSSCSVGEFVDSTLSKLSPALSSNWANTDDLIRVKEKIDLLDRLVNDNLRHFWSIRDSQPSARPFGNALIRLQTLLQPLLHDTFVLAKCAPTFDFSEHSRGNGYRSLLHVVHSCLLVLCEALESCLSWKSHVLFHINNVNATLGEFIPVLETLLQLCKIAIASLRTSTCDCIFGQRNSSIISTLKSVRKDHFYGTSFGFQFSDQVRTQLKAVITVMASLSSVYAQERDYDLDQKGPTDVMKVGILYRNVQYYFQEKKRGEQLSDQFARGDVGFLRHFWNITESEIASHISLAFSPKPFVNAVFQVPAQTITLPGKNGEEVVIRKPPSSERYSFKTVQIRIMSYDKHAGQMFADEAGEQYDTTLPPAAGILVHIHGGGFVSQSSKSHEVYLRHWAYVLRVPIVSIDYSLAPENPYPQALHECFYAYAWVLRHAKALGSNAETVCLAGDSAGGNLCLSVALMAQKLGIRGPDAIMPVYPTLALLLDLPSPSRTLSVMDPLISFGALVACFRAYVAEYEHADTDELLSPWLASESQLRALPPIYMVAATFDPLLDDAVDFARKLQRLGHPIEFVVAPGVPHGFLSFVHTSAQGSEIAAAAMLCENNLRRVFKLPPADESVAAFSSDAVAATTTAVFASAKSLALFSQEIMAVLVGGPEDHAEALEDQNVGADGHVEAKPPTSPSVQRSSMPDGGLTAAVAKLFGAAPAQRRSEPVPGANLTAPIRRTGSDVAIVTRTSLADSEGEGADGIANSMSAGELFTFADDDSLAGISPPHTPSELVPQSSSSNAQLGPASLAGTVGREGAVTPTENTDTSAKNTLLVPRRCGSAQSDHSLTDTDSVEGGLSMLSIDGPRATAADGNRAFTTAALTDKGTTVVGTGEGALQPGGAKIGKPTEQDPQLLAPTMRATHSDTAVPNAASTQSQSTAHNRSNSATESNRQGLERSDAAAHNRSNSATEPSKPGPEHVQRAAPAQSVSTAHNRSNSTTEPNRQGPEHVRRASLQVLDNTPVKLVQALVATATPVGAVARLSERTREKDALEGVIKALETGDKQEALRIARERLEEVKAKLRESASS